MAYQSWSVVFGEQPSAAKWNILGTNDSSFNDGTGIGTNAIAAASLATSAITLGFASTTSAQTSITTEVDLTSLSVTVTVPSGSRRLFIVGYVLTDNTVADAYNIVNIKESTTQLQRASCNSRSGSALETLIPIYSATGVSTGSHTYKLTGIGNSTGSGSMSTGSSSTTPSFIWVGVL